MDTLAYITSEQFIWDGLKQQAQIAVEHCSEVWAKRRKIPCVLILWPAETIKADDGTPLETPCSLDLPEDRKAWPGLMRKAIERTRAYAILLVEQEEKQVRLLLESPHGTRCWRIPIKKSGDAYFLGETEQSDDAECLGYFWQRKKGPPS